MTSIKLIVSPQKVMPFSLALPDYQFSPKNNNNTLYLCRAEIMFPIHPRLKKQESKLSPKNTSVLIYLMK